MSNSLWILPFGKYDGHAIEDIDSDYLEWLLDQDWFVKKFVDGSKAIKKELKYRQNFGKG